MQISAPRSLSKKIVVRPSASADRNFCSWQSRKLSSTVLPLPDWPMMRVLPSIIWPRQSSSSPE
ncbi:Uncharacterised protein [Bordetella pertussis]|nr:Uncharacterised protein [Bordetella pertussis]